MKTRFTTIDLRAAVAEIGSRLLGLRVVNVYDINNKTYLIKLAGQDVKEVLLLESGLRVHMTSFDWPKNNMPSNFSMKLRKHVRGRRLENIRQLGMDRAVDLQFGSGEAAYHLIVELYDRGNIALTDHEFTILTVLRARSDNDDVRFVAKEKYPIDKVRKTEGAPDETKIREILKDAPSGQNLKKLLNPNFVFGPALIEHCLLTAGFPSNCLVGKDFNLEKDVHRVVEALAEAQGYLQASGETASKGYIIQRKDKKPAALKEQTENTGELLTFSEFHPFLFKQFEDGPYVEFGSFTECLDEFFSKQEGQKLDMKALQQEKDALKKLDNVKRDQERRINSLQKSQTVDQIKGELIEVNLPLVDEAIRVVRSAIANQIDWKEIEEIIKDAQKQGDIVAKCVKSLKLEMNHITMMLQYPHQQKGSDDSDDDEQVKGQQPMKVDIDLGLSAYANARRFFDLKKHSKKKEQKTVDAADKAIKSAEKKTKQALKDVAIVTSINKTRKTYWFEKFFWFVSSENYLVIAGRDKQQNEIIYKRYLKSGDIYVHADLHGASSLVIKNLSGGPVPPKTLNEAGTMAVCFSVAWEAKVITSAWWVNSDQVSKTAPTGEYLTTGSFMIRGKKNYLPPVQLMMGFGFLFKLEDTCIGRHKGERKIWTGGIDDDTSSYTTSSVGEPDMEIKLDESDSKSEQGSETPANQNKEDEITEDVAAEPTTKDEEDEDEEVQTEEQTPRNDDSSKSSGSDGEGMDYPDTAIDLHHVTGVRASSTSNKTDNTEKKHDTISIHLGDDIPVQINDRTDSQGKKRLTAKQRREQKRKKKQTWADEGDAEDGRQEEEDVKEEIEEDKEQDEVKTISAEDESSTKIPENTDQNPGQPAQLKRGQKHKLKKMKQKYRDQDDEERRLKMELLASSGAPREKTKKGRKAKQKNQQPSISGEKPAERQPKHQQLNVTKRTTPVKDGGEGQVVEVITETLEETEIEDKAPQEITNGVASIEVKHVWKAKGDEGDDEDDTGIEEGQFSQENSSIIDSLTGCPHEEDLLLFAIPVCAPYSAMQNYKFKVKVTPGTGKKGKAAKAAMNMFQVSKECTPREKDLFKGCKDVDLSRNMPGKVKISAPNLQKARKTAKGK